jgi:hypothetical protein
VQRHARPAAHAALDQLDPHPVPVELPSLVPATRRSFDHHAIPGYGQPLPIACVSLHVRERDRQYRDLDDGVGNHRPCAGPGKREGQQQTEQRQRCENRPPSARAQRIVPARDDAILEVDGGRRKDSARHGIVPRTPVKLPNVASMLQSDKILACFPPCGTAVHRAFAARKHVLCANAHGNRVMCVLFHSHLRLRPCTP